MSFGETCNPNQNGASLVDRMIGSAYRHVKIVADAIDQVKFVAYNMQAIVIAAQQSQGIFESSALLPTFVDDPTAATGNIPIGGYYWNGSAIVQRRA
jgi:hypothetical protein